MVLGGVVIRNLEVSRYMDNILNVIEDKKIRTIRQTTELRWHTPSLIACAQGMKTLQQAYIGVEDGIIEWRDIAMVVGNG